MDEKKDAINSLVDRFQLAGLDDRQRGFSRPVDIDPVEGQYRARLRYESTQIVTAPAKLPVRMSTFATRTLSSLLASWSASGSDSASMPSPNCG